MPVNLPDLPNLPPISGVSIASCAAGIAYKNREDLVLFSLSNNSKCAAVFTNNSFAAAPVQIARKNLSKTSPSYWLINSGNANAATGKQGINNCLKTCQYVADKTGVGLDEIIPFSTGVIGAQLPLEPFEKSIDTLVKQLSPNNWNKAAKAIMTTDTKAKGISISCPYQNSSFTINAIVKGSGMINPNMATMLAFIATDINISTELLQTYLKKAVNESFNSISVDGDTSTNDAVIVAATGKSQLPLVDENQELSNIFFKQLLTVCRNLAESVIRDAEGATKFIKIIVEQAQNEQEAKKVARTIALSPLVKTATFASDPNWGRILNAVGYSGIENLDCDKVSLEVNGVLIAKNGCVDDNYTEEMGVQAFKNHDIEMHIKLGRGEAISHFLTSDLSHDYVTINSDYRS